MDPLDKGSEIAQRLAAVYGGARQMATVGSSEDQGILKSVGEEYPPLRSLMDYATVKQTPPAPGDDRHLEFYPKGESHSPNPNRTVLEMFDNTHGDDRKRAITADALHGIHDDPTWSHLRGELVNQRSPGQRRIDSEAFGREHEKGDTMKSWMDRSRSDAYVRAGLFPRDNPEWQLPEGDPEGFTPEQRIQFARMQNYLHTGREPFSGQDLMTAMRSAK